MEIEFTYIRNQIRKYSKDDLLSYCYNYIDSKDEQIFAIWYIFILMKWTYLHAGYSYPSKKLTQNDFAKIYNLIYNFNQNHISNFLKVGIDRGFYILYSQQFYLQRVVYKEIFATQIKLYSSLKGKYDIEKSFEEKTNLTVKDFIIILQVVWIYVNSKSIKDNPLNFFGHLSPEFVKLLGEMFGQDKVTNFLNLIVLNPNETNDKIQSFKRSINKEKLQVLETTFFTLYPFQIFNNRVKFLHKSVFNYCVNYYLYDFLKTNDEAFTTEFGNRFEKYVELSINEITQNYKTEKDLKKILPKDSNLIDFYLNDENLFIECKAIEIQAYTSINPTDELLYNSLKNSILKAYFNQLLNTAKFINPNGENWGVILTYKELFWSTFEILFNLGKDKFKNSDDSTFLPPQNVFIIDIYTWDKIIQIVKDKKASLLDILKLARSNNSKSETTKQLFNMHLDDFVLEKMNLSYLNDELEFLKISE